MLVAKCRKIFECIVLLGGKPMKTYENVNFDIGIGSVGTNPVANMDIGSVGSACKSIKNVQNHRGPRGAPPKSQRPTRCICFLISGS